MEVALLKAKLAGARSDIQSKDKELALLDAELQSKLRSMETVPEDSPLSHFRAPLALAPKDAPPRHLDAALAAAPPARNACTIARAAADAAGALGRADAGESRSLSIQDLQAQLVALRGEVQQRESRLASQLAGLSAGSKALAAQLAHEREERTAAVADLRRDLDEQLVALCSEDLHALLQDAQERRLRGSLGRTTVAGDCAEVQVAHAVAPPLHGVAACGQRQEARDGDQELLKLRRSLEALSDHVVCKNDTQWLQASETMVRLSEMCGQLSAKVSLLATRLEGVDCPDKVVDALAPHADAPTTSPTTCFFAPGEVVDSVPTSCCAETPEASTTTSVVDEGESTSARDFSVALKQMETEVALLAKAVMSNQREMTDRIGEERSVRRAAEAVLDARIKTVEHQVKRRPNGGSIPGDSRAHSPALTPASSRANLGLQGARHGIDRRTS